MRVQDISAIGSHYLDGQYLTGAYFPGVSSTQMALKFEQTMKARLGVNRTITAEMEKVYTMVIAYAAAVTRAQSFGTDQVRAAMQGLVFESPQGAGRQVYNSHLTSRYFRLARYVIIELQ